MSKPISVPFKGYDTRKTGYTNQDQDQDQDAFRFLLNVDGMPTWQVDLPNGWTVSAVQTIGTAFYHVAAIPRPDHFLNPGRRVAEYHSDWSADELAALIQQVARRK